MSEKKRQRVAWGLSLVFHVVFLLIVMTSGVLSMIRMDIAKDTDVYEVSVDTAPSGDSGAAAPEAASPAAPSIPDIALPTAKEEWIPKELPPKETPVKSKENPTETSAVNPTVTTAVSKPENGTGESTGKGTSEGTGSGEGNGNSSGSNGSGHGNGNGNGDGGVSEAQRRQPKTPPVLLSAKEPRYPQSLRNAGVEGRVRVRMLIGPSGSVESVEVIESSGHSAMDQAAVKSAYGYRFRPARNVFDEPVKAYITRRIGFSLR